VDDGVEAVGGDSDASLAEPVGHCCIWPEGAVGG
jgi:hypothetical protein